MTTLFLLMYLKAGIWVPFFNKEMTLELCQTKMEQLQKRSSRKFRCVKIK